MYSYTFSAATYIHLPGIHSNSPFFLFVSLSVYHGKETPEEAERSSLCGGLNSDQEKVMWASWGSKKKGDKSSRRGQTSRRCFGERQSQVTTQFRGITTALEFYIGEYMLYLCHGKTGRPRKYEEIVFREALKICTFMRWSREHRLAQRWTQQRCFKRYDVQAKSEFSSTKLRVLRSSFDVFSSIFGLTILLNILSKLYSLSYADANYRYTSVE